MYIFVHSIQSRINFNIQFQHSIDDEDEVKNENYRLIRKRIGLRSNFTEIVNSITNLITASRFQNGAVNKSQANIEALKRAREKLERRYEKLQALNTRQLVITQDEETDVREAGHYQGNIDNAAERYNQVIRDLSQLDEALQPQTNGNINNLMSNPTSSNQFKL